LPVSIQVDQWNEYDRLYVYLLPDKLTSFMRLTGADGKYSEKIDELMKYDLVCIGYKDEQAYFNSRKTIQSKDYAGITLSAIGRDELDQELNRFGSLSQGSAIRRENEFFQFEITDTKRKKTNIALGELTVRIMKLIFPCYDESL